MTIAILAIVSVPVAIIVVALARVAGSDACQCPYECPDHLSKADAT